MGTVLLPGMPTCMRREAQQHLQRQLSLLQASTCQLSAAARWQTRRCPRRRRRRQRCGGGLAACDGACAGGPNRAARQAGGAGGAQALQQRVDSWLGGQQAQQAGRGVQHEAQRAQRLQQVPPLQAPAGRSTTLTPLPVRLAISCCHRLGSRWALGACLCRRLLLGTGRSARDRGTCSRHQGQQADANGRFNCTQPETASRAALLQVAIQAAVAPGIIQLNTKQPGLPITTWVAPPEGCTCCAW